jgi:hypothetical protein
VPSSPYPSLYQINTRVWLTELSRELSNRATLDDLGDRQWQLQDQMGTTAYDRAGNDLQSRGLYLDVAPWCYHVFRVQKV